MKDKKQILVTGASGFIGSQFCNTAKQNGFTVIHLGRRTSPSYDEFTPDNLMPNSTILHLAGISTDNHKISLKEYKDANVNLTMWLWGIFIKSEAKNFIFMSSIKAVESNDQTHFTENSTCEPEGQYGRSKLEAERFLINGFSSLTDSERLKRNLFILRPGLVYGNHLKGNLKSLFQFVSKGLPYPLAAFNNERTMLSLNNLEKVILTLINKSFNGKSEAFLVADDKGFSTNEILLIAGQVLEKKAYLLKTPIPMITAISWLGGALGLPFNKRFLNKLTGDQLISNQKILNFLQWDSMPFSSQEELKKAFISLR